MIDKGTYLVIPSCWHPQMFLQYLSTSSTWMIKYRSSYKDVRAASNHKSSHHEP